jgi:ribonuclease G
MTGSWTADIPKEGKLADVLSASQSILVQIAKEPISTKGPRFTAEVTLAGRYMVLVPFINKVSISSRASPTRVERKRLKELMQAIVPRTSASSSAPTRKASAPRISRTI